MIILHFHLLPQFKNEKNIYMNYFITSHQIALVLFSPEHLALMMPMWYQEILSFPTEQHKLSFVPLCYYFEIFTIQVPDSIINMKEFAM